MSYAFIAGSLCGLRLCSRLTADMLNEEVVHNHFGSVPIAVCSRLTFVVPSASFDSPAVRTFQWCFILLLVQRGRMVIRLRDTMSQVRLDLNRSILVSS